jgi:hypothetical protein
MRGNRVGMGHNRTVPQLRHLLPLSLVLGCTSEKTEDTGAIEAQSCESSVDLSFPDGTGASFKGCNDVLADATFEFDPDDPPEIRSFRFQLTGNVDPGFDCWLIVTGKGICGPGYYDIGPSESTEVQFQIHDCPYVSDEFENSYDASGGILLIESISAGSEPGNFAGIPLLTHLQGAIESTTTSGVGADVSFDLKVRITGDDAEETICDKAE